MATQVFDLLVIGGGIYGVCVAWDAALRGLRVALVEQGEFGAATSANSLKTLHGGLRYLQEANLARMRLMIRERRAWLRIAPDLTRPLPFLLPTGGKLSRHKQLMRIALLINDLVGWDRNQGLLSEKHLPQSRILSRNACLTLLPGLSDLGVNGGALWYDAQVLDTEQLLTDMLHAAIAKGTKAANHAAVTGFIQDASTISGCIVTDRLTGEHHEIKADLVINCAGAWSDALLRQINGRTLARTFHLSTAVNLVTRQILSDVAVGLPSRWQGRERILFIAPWQDYSLIGTWHAPYFATEPAYQVDEPTIQSCLEEVNAAYPPARLHRADVYQVHVGYLPVHPTENDSVQLVRESMIVDHARTDQLDGLVSVIGVKYTTARHTAERAVHLAMRKLGKTAVPCRTAYTPIPRFCSQNSPRVDTDGTDVHG